jgi:hypothetical protein
MGAPAYGTTAEKPLRKPLTSMFAATPDVDVLPLVELAD